MHALARIRRSERLAGERGFIMITALLILAILLITITALTLAATDNTTTAHHTELGTQALAAADAGAQVGLFRLDYGTSGSTGTTAGTGSLGNGATYSYAVTRLSSQSSACTGLWIQNASVNQDCITATGTQNGVSQTVEERVAGYAPQTLFPVSGVFAINGISTTNAPTGTFDIGTNGGSSLHGESETGKLEYPQGNPPNYNGTQNTCGNSGNANCVPTPESSAITVPTLAAGVYQAALQSNNDASISWVDAGNPGCGSVSYTASTHEVGGSSNGCVFNIPSGTYYFCNVSFSGSTTLDVTPPAYIYIDSPADSATSPKCPSGDGYFESGNQFEINNGPNNTGGASGLQIYIYGGQPCTSSCANYFNPNGSTLNAYVFAPYSAFQPGGAFTMVGALVAAALTANNAFSFTYQAPTTTLVGSSSQTTFYPAAHGVCPSSYSTSGC